MKTPLATAFAVLVLAGAAASQPLPSFDADLGRVTVSGLSSGAYMAGQFHVAFSELVDGAGIVAGGPYDCADGTITLALFRCMATTFGAPNPGRLVERAEDRAARGEIDPLAGLAADRVYVFSGTEDETVWPRVAATVDDFYRLAGVPDAAIAVSDTLPAGHAFVTETEGGACAVSEPPFVNDCDEDQAGAILEQLSGPLAPPAARPDGRLIAFDQATFLPAPTTHGMAETGFAYVPTACDGGGCGVHVVFHGCRQTAGLVGDAVTARAGYNRWADSNRLIMLYPQAEASNGNQKGCWDWWGYDDALYATRDGRQVRAVRAMLDRLAGIELPVQAAGCARFEASNLGHWRAGRARVCSVWFFCAVGSGDRLGMAAASTTLFERPGGSFATACAA